MKHPREQFLVLETQEAMILGDCWENYSHESQNKGRTAGKHLPRRDPISTNSNFEGVSAASASSEMYVWIVHSIILMRSDG